MKKLNLLFILFGLTAIGFMSSCDTTEDTTDEVPNIVLSPSSDQTAVEGSNVAVEIVLTENTVSKSVLKTFVIDGISLDTTINFPSNTHTYTETVVFTAPVAGQQDVIKFTLTDKAGKVSTKTLKITGTSATTDLNAAESFTMVRCGNNNDPERFGLRYDQNNTASTAMIITSTAEKLVELTSGEWSSITTQEALKDAVDNGAASTSFTLDFGGTTQTLNKVVATKVGSVYTLIHFTSSVSEGGQACGTRVTLSGEYKD